MKELKVSAINKGTVIDHIPSGKGLKVLEILNLPKDNTILVAINVKSRKLGKKDIIKVEGKILSEDEVNKIALIAPTATVNIIDKWEVVDKKKVEVPDEIVGIIKCANPNCITNYEEVKPKFKVISKKPLKLKCHYCERTMEEGMVVKNLL